jgi:hypothetical protein
MLYFLCSASSTLLAFLSLTLVPTHALSPSYFSSLSLTRTHTHARFDVIHLHFRALSLFSFKPDRFPPFSPLCLQRTEIPAVTSLKGPLLGCHLATSARASVLPVLFFLVSPSPGVCSRRFPRASPASRLENRKVRAGLALRLLPLSPRHTGDKPRAGNGREQREKEERDNAGCTLREPVGFSLTGRVQGPSCLLRRWPPPPSPGAAAVPAAGERDDGERARAPGA